MRSPNASIARPSLSCDPVLTSGRNRVAKVSNKVVADPTPARSLLYSRIATQRCTIHSRRVLRNPVQRVHPLTRNSLTRRFSNHRTP